jgi:hypothetical protein
VKGASAEVLQEPVLFFGFHAPVRVSLDCLSIKIAKILPVVTVDPHRRNYESSI